MQRWRQPSADAASRAEQQPILLGPTTPSDQDSLMTQLIGLVLHILQGQRHVMFNVSDFPNPLQMFI